MQKAYLMITVELVTARNHHESFQKPIEQQLKWWRLWYWGGEGGREGGGE